jgi:BASS family bile acid:Na+ symporter
MNVLMPAFAAILAAVFHLHPAVKIALIFLAVSPVPPILPRAQLKLGATSHYIFGLLVSAALLSIVTVPLTVEILGRAFGQDVHVSLATLIRVISTSILLPLGVGMVINHLWPELARKASSPLSGIAFLLLIASAAVFLVATLPGIWALIGNGTVLAIAAFVVVGAAIGHWLGGPDESNRSALALATASRHPGLAMALAGAGFPAQKKLVIAAVFLYLLVKGLVLVPYNSWQKQRISLADDRREMQPKQRVA